MERLREVGQRRLKIVLLEPNDGRLKDQDIDKNADGKARHRAFQLKIG